MSAPRWLPEAIRERIDTGELATLSADAEARRARLEARLGVHVVAYRRDARADDARLSLCRVLEAAPLSHADLEALRENEDRETVLVAYAKPTRLRAGFAG